jgi:hypothetical protein
MLSKLWKYIRHRFVPYNTTIQDHHTMKLQTFSCPFSFSNPQASHFIVLCSCMVVLYGTNLCLMYFPSLDSINRLRRILSLDSINRLRRILNSLFYVYFTVFDTHYPMLSCTHRVANLLYGSLVW